MRRATTLFAIIVAALFIGPEIRAQKSSDSPEYVFKAGYILKFVPYVEWPAATFAKADSPVVIGVLGDDSFARILEEVTSGEKVGGRSLVIRRFRWNKDVKVLKECNILFVASTETAHSDDVIQLLRTSPILTISDVPGFAKRGGIMNFFLEDERVRFEINVEASKQANLNISSGLLGLAKIVQTGLASK